MLTRRPGESILIGDDIEVTVLSGSRGNQIRLAIKAPITVQILRSELQGRVRKNDDGFEDDTAVLDGCTCAGLPEPPDDSCPIHGIDEPGAEEGGERGDDDA